MSSWFKSFGTLHHGFGGRFKLGSLAPAEEFDEAVTKGQLDHLFPVPFASSVQVQYAQESVLEGQIAELDLSVDIPVSAFSIYIGVIFYVDISRGTAWGEIPIALDVNEDSIFNITGLTPSIAEGKTNTLVQVQFDPLQVVADTTHFIAFTIGDESFSQTRTLTINIVADPE